MIDPASPPLMVVTKFNFLKFLRTAEVTILFSERYGSTAPIFGKEKVQYTRPVARPPSNAP
jgi:hypothetical protein